MLAYRLEMLTEEQIADQDPFAGAGVRLDTDGLAQETAGLLLTETFRSVPHVIFPCCAWLDSRGFPEGLSDEAAQIIWREQVLPGQRDGGDGDR